MKGTCETSENLFDLFTSVSTETMKQNHLAESQVFGNSDKIKLEEGDGALTKS